MIGYIWGVEQGGKSKGFHCHLAIIYDNAYRDGSAAYWGMKLLSYGRILLEVMVKAIIAGTVNV